MLFTYVTFGLEILGFQIWNLGSPDPNFTLDAHLKGVNCVDYFTGGDKPYLITGSDDHTAKVCFDNLFLCSVVDSTHIKTELYALDHGTGLGLSDEKLCPDS